MEIVEKYAACGWAVVQMDLDGGLPPWYGVGAVLPIELDVQGIVWIRVWDKINEHTDQGLGLQVAWVEAHTTDKDKAQMTRENRQIALATEMAECGSQRGTCSCQTCCDRSLGGGFFVGMNEFSEGMMHKPEEQVNVGLVGRKQHQCWRCGMRSFCPS